MIARRAVYLWGSSYYIGQMAKDMFMLPRPPPDLVIDCTTLSSIKDAFYRKSPPSTPVNNKIHGVIRLERHYETEGGMPSTHTMNALSMPWLIVYLVYQRVYRTNWDHLGTNGMEYKNNIHNDTSFFVVVGVAVLWSVLCIVSRLYMGVHSPADMIIGGAIGILMLGIHVLYGEALDMFFLTSTSSLSLSSLFSDTFNISSFLGNFLTSPWFLPTFSAFLAYVYPRPAKPRWVSTPGDTTLILGVVAGVTLASVLVIQTVKLRLQKDHPNRTYTDYDVIQYLNHRPIHIDYHYAEIMGMLVRFVVGVAIMMLTRLILKALTLPLFITLIGHEYAPKDELDDNLSSDNRYSTHTAPINSDDTTLSTSKESSVSNEKNGSSTTSTGTLRQRRPHVQLSYDESQNNQSKNNDPATNDNDPPGKLRIKLPHNPFDTSSTSTVTKTKDTSTGTKPSTTTVVPEMVKIAPFRRYIIELPVKFITYFFVGFQAPFTTVYVFQHFLPSSLGKDYEFI